MAEKAHALPPKKRVRFKLTPDPPSAGSSPGGGGGGGAGAGAAAPRSILRRGSSCSRSRLPSPPEPFTYYGDTGAGSGGGGGGDGAAAARSPSPPEPFTYYGDIGAGSSGGGGGNGAAAARPTPQQEPSTSRPLPDDDDDDDYDEYYEGFQEEELDVQGSLFMSLPQVLCRDSSEPPRYIGRQNCEPLLTLEYFSLRLNWQQLLDGKKTYLRPPKNKRVAKHKYADCLFATPEPLEKAVQCQEPLSDFVREATENSIVQQKFKILSEHYVCVRRMRMDGSSFYRAFLFSYLENLGKMQGAQAEVTRLMERVARSKENFCQLHWDSAYFSNPEAFFSSVVSEFEHLLNSVANGLSSDELYKISLQEITSSRMLSLLRLLTEVHIRTHHVDYEFSQTEALSFCKVSVRPFDADGDPVEMSALSNALGIPLRLAYMDITMNKDGIVRVQCADFFPPSESGVRTASGPLRSVRSYYLSSATDRAMPAGNLISSDHMPLVTLLSRIGQCDILYRKF